ncbi:hypothetical protein Acr_10g0006720 [Actinidia rufa]|uniref:Disease resistance R13L4/SHOC-2-like LRR domain-containing protein n=1 Tax=Actinidia rufa TaxID=165716 RepID=A0A7J0FBM7_9ERIC|nr:hypothetical protein Acr_10g0006720 [Actinidia rufa]
MTLCTTTRTRNKDSIYKPHLIQSLSRKPLTPKSKNKPKTPPNQSIGEATSHPSSSSHDTHNPSVQYASPSQANSLKHHLHDAASSSATIINKNEDNDNRSHALCKSISKDLIFINEKIEEEKKYVDHVDVQVKKAHVKFKELQEKESPEGELDEFKKDIKKLKSKIPAQCRTYSADSNTNRNSWPDINKSNDEMMYMMEPKVEDTMDPAHLQNDFFDLDWYEKRCLLRFLLFPPKAVIRRRVMIYLWIVDYDLDRMDEYIANKILDKFTKSGLIKPVYQKFSALYEEETYLTNLYLGRWQSSTTHHIEVANTNSLHWSNNLEKLRGPAYDRFAHVVDTHLDMSECYFLEYIPKSLGNLTRLQVLKGFFIGDSKEKRLSCTLDDLSRLQYLRKLNIYTSAKDFPTDKHLNALQKFRALRKLTISWGGCSPQGEDVTDCPQTDLALPSTLQKLELQCFRWKSPPNWLRVTRMEELKKLYIIGGKLRDLGQLQNLVDIDRWAVNILRLKYLDELEMDWRDLMILFPDLIFMHKVECRKLTDFKCDDNGVWIYTTAINQAHLKEIKC